MVSSSSGTPSRLWIWRATSWSVGLLLIVCVAIPGLFDAVSIQERRHELSDLQEDVVETRSRKQRLERRREDVDRKLQRLSERGFVDGGQERVRNHWLEVIRKRNGKIRQMDVGEVITRPWGGLKDRIKLDVYLDDDPSALFELHSATFSMVVEGSLETVLGVMGDLVDRPPLSVIESISIAPVSNDSNELLQLKIELRLFGLTGQEPSSDDDYA